MAKKTVHSDKISDTKVNAAWKQCHKCHKWNKGLTTKTCYACGEPFTIAGKKNKNHAPARQVAGMTFTDAVKQVDKVKSFIDDCGGFDKARNKLADFETLLAGSTIADLKEAIGILESHKSK